MIHFFFITRVQCRSNRRKLNAHLRIPAQRSGRRITDTRHLMITSPWRICYEGLRSACTSDHIRWMHKQHIGHVQARRPHWCHVMRCRPMGNQQIVRVWSSFDSCR